MELWHIWSELNTMYRDEGNFPSVYDLLVRQSRPLTSQVPLTPWLILLPHFTAWLFIYIIIPYSLYCLFCYYIFFIHCTTHDLHDHPHYSYPPTIFPTHSHLTCPSPYQYISHYALYFTTTDEDPLNWVETSGDHWQVTSVPIPRLGQFPESEAQIHLTTQRLNRR